MESTKRKFEVGDEVLIVKSTHHNNFIEDRRGIITLIGSSIDSYWVKVDNHEYFLHGNRFELRLLTKLDKALK